MIGFILYLLVIGVIAGFLARAIVPGDDSMSVGATIVLGIVGSFLGGFLGNLLTGSGLNGFSLWSVLLAIVGSLILLWIYRATTRSRGTTL